MFSGFDERSTTRQLQNFREYLLKERSEPDDRYMSSLAYTLNERRTIHAYRAAVVGTSPATLTEALSGQIKIVKAHRRPSIGFVFTGQGAQWTGMGKELLEAYPIFRESIQRIDDYIKTIGAPYCMVGTLIWYYPLPGFTSCHDQHPLITINRRDTEESRNFAIKQSPLQPAYMLCPSNSPDRSTSILGNSSRLGDRTL